MCATVRPYSAPVGLPKRTKSLCPECGKKLEATIYEKDGKVFMEKECPEHGRFDDIYWSDAKKYLEAEGYAKDGTGLRNPMDDSLGEGENVNVVIDGERVDMLSPTALANIDLTNRCNMHCPICFANAADQGYVYEPDVEAIGRMLDALRAEEPIKCTAVQFSGGEPTVSPHVIEAIRMAKERGFAQVQVASNGIKFAADYGFLKACARAGMNTIYLQFDGLDDDIYMRSRGRKMWEVKQSVIGNCRRLKAETGHSPSIVLVVTTVHGLNDTQIGDILRYAIKNRDVVRGVNYQPVAFTGRVTREEVSEGRITLTDVARCVNEETGYTNMNDWYPVPVVSGISNYASIILGTNKITFPTHPHCGLATYLFIDDKENVTPMPEFIDVERFTKGLDDIAAKAEQARFKKLTALKVKKLLDSCLIEERMPEGMTKALLVQTLLSIMSRRSKKTLAKFSWGMMYVGAMHFQDGHNYDFERVRRCSIHYVTPDCRIVPFCAYNSGICLREETERRFSVPVKEWIERNREEAAKDSVLVVPKDPEAEGGRSS